MATASQDGQKVLLHLFSSFSSCLLREYTSTLIRFATHAEGLRHVSASAHTHHITHFSLSLNCNMESYWSNNVHYMAKSMWTHACRTSHFKIIGINMELVGPPFAATTASTLLGRLSTTFENIAAGTCCHSATRISEAGHWWWVIRPGLQSAFQFIPKVFDGVEVRALCRPVKFFHTVHHKPLMYGPRFVYGGIVTLKQERAFPKLLPQRWKHRII